nr:MAG TPA: hypothetical protein [Caudoviricetes sp.]
MYSMCLDCCPAAFAAQASHSAIFCGIKAPHLHL